MKVVVRATIEKYDQRKQGWMRPMNQCPTSGNNDYHIYVYVFVVVVTTMIRE